MSNEPFKIDQASQWLATPQPDGVAPAAAFSGCMVSTRHTVAGLAVFSTGLCRVVPSGRDRRLLRHDGMGKVHRFIASRSCTGKLAVAGNVLAGIEGAARSIPRRGLPEIRRPGSRNGHRADLVCAHRIRRRDVVVAFPIEMATNLHRRGRYVCGTIDRSRCRSGMESHGSRVAESTLFQHSHDGQRDHHPVQRKSPDAIRRILCPFRLDGHTESVH